MTPEPPHADEIPRPAEAPGRRRILAGIDEAGLGPLLGPLCFGWSVFEAPVDSTDDLWRVLQEVVSDDPKRDKARLIVADSKRVFSRNQRGLKRLENVALSFLAQRDPARHPPLDARELVLGGPCSADAQELDRHPWYTRLETLPVASERGSVELKAERLHRGLARAEIEVLDLGVRLVPAGELNASFRDTGNKATTVWGILLDILRGLWVRHGRQGLRVVVDRQGGRWHYGPLLGRGFPDASVRLVTESPGYSEFDLRGPRGRNDSCEPAPSMRIAFAERGENQSFAVALGSCLAKYSRELAMRAFNAYFRDLDPELIPTAGYRNDGHRWVEEAADTLRQARIDRELLVRRR